MAVNSATPQNVLPTLLLFAGDNAGESSNIMGAAI
jgi:hypothetical protein